MVVAIALYFRIDDKMSASFRRFFGRNLRDVVRVPVNISNGEQRYLTAKLSTLDVFEGLSVAINLR